MRQKAILCQLAATCALAGCGAGAGGDWFRCLSPSCEQLSDNGLELASDDDYAVLEAPGSTLEPDESYCEMRTPAESGTYSYDGKVLVTTSRSGQREVASFELAGARATMVLGGATLVWQRLDEPRSIGACADNRHR